MQFNIRPYKKDDYEMVKGWWLAHGWGDVSPELLPGIGFIIYNETYPVVAGWLYKTDSRIGWIEWIISNPSSNKEVRNIAQDLLISKLVEAAKENQILALFTSSNHPKLIERYTRHGFIETDSKVTHLIRRVD